MATQTYASDELHAEIEKYMDKAGCSYVEAMRRVTGDHPDLARRYARGESESAPDPKDKKGAAEFSMRVENYASHFQISRAEAERRVREHDPLMRKFYIHGGEVMMKKIVPLSPESVVHDRVQAKMAKGEAKEYGAAMRAVLAEDDRLNWCYQKNLPFIESSGAHSYQDEMPNVTAKSQLGVLVNGARNADNSIDIPLALSVCALVPDLVRRAAGERLTEVANALIDRLGLRGQRSERFLETLRQAERENPALVAAQNSGRLDEQGFRDIFWTWFSRDRD